ncbi:MAG: ATPase, T2SS/T4P/T4SS family [Patescibacteria group bacterium]
MSSQTDVFFQKIIASAAARGATDVHLTVGQPPLVRVDGTLTPLEDEGILAPATMEEFVMLLFDEQARQELSVKRRATIARTVGSRVRFKATVIYQQGYPFIFLHFLSPTLRTLKELGLPKVVEELSFTRKGLMFVTGPHGSGRSTTMASFLNTININRPENIVTIEHPIEYILTADKSVIEQQEVGRDVPSILEGLQALKNEDVNVVAVSEIPDRFVFEELINLTEGGRLVVAPLDAETLSQAFEHIVESYAAHERERICHSLADNLIAVIGVRLVPRVGGGSILVAEVLVVSAPVKALIRDGRFSQISSWVLTAREGGTVSLDRSLAELVKTGEVLLEDALREVSDKESFQRMVKGA